MTAAAASTASASAHRGPAARRGRGSCACHCQHELTAVAGQSKRTYQQARTWLLQHRGAPKPARRLRQGTGGQRGESGEATPASDSCPLTSYRWNCLHLSANFERGRSRVGRPFVPYLVSGPARPAAPRHSSACFWLICSSNPGASLSFCCRGAAAGGRPAPSRSRHSRASRDSQPATLSRLATMHTAAFTCAPCCWHPTQPARECCRSLPERLIRQGG